MTEAKKTWKPQRLRLSDQVAKKIKSRILDGRYPAGERLPSERLLAEQLGVTRLTLREALKECEASGFTQTRHGDGTYVCNVRQDATLEILSEILNVGRDLKPEEIRSLLEFREVVCTGFAEAIARNTTSEHVRRLFDIIEKERTMLDDVDVLMELDCDFHQLVAEASGNVIYSLLFRSVRPAYLYLSKIVFEADDDYAAIVDGHEDIAKAVQARNAEQIKSSLSEFIVAGNSAIQNS
jgi:GntR family transcriptional repressor for pyruvate dehydrogenase complex